MPLSAAIVTTLAKDLGANYSYHKLLSADIISGMDAVPDASVPFHSVGYSLSALGFAVAQRFRQALEPLELEPREFSLLRAVGAAEGESQHTIAERLGIPPSRMVAFLDELEDRGLVERRPNSRDRRARALHLTRAGRRRLARAFAAAAAFERKLCAGLGEAEREQLLGLLGRLGEDLGLASAGGPALAHPALTGL
jgi:DNA-binding MarR family transcriptional regulator